MTDEASRKIAGFLGLCARAGQLTMGQEACVTAIRQGKAALGLLDEGASENSRKRLSDSCQSHQTPLYLIPKGLLAQAVGKDGRMAATLPKGRMADRLSELLTGESPYLYTNE